MPTDLSEIKTKLAVMEQKMKTLEVTVASSLERLRTDTYRAIIGSALGTVILLGFLITILDRNSQPSPSAYQPPAASVLPDSN